MSLIEDAKNKNPDAFEQLIQPQLQRMYRVAISMLHNEEDAADAIQKTVLKCWQKIGQLKSEEYFGTWLTRILINQCKDILKERKKVVPLEEFPELIHEDHYFTNEWRKILSNLNGKYQIVMELYYVDGFSTKEIARIYDFTTYNSETDMIDNVNDHMSKMDVWDLDTLTCTSSNANIEMLHAIYNYVEEEYADATFNVEYYVNVSDIIRDENTGYVKEIIGEKVDRQTYEKSEASLWSGEQITTLSISDYDKIYADDNLLEALAQCYLKNRM